MTMELNEGRVKEKEIYLLIYHAKEEGKNKFEWLITRGPQAVIEYQRIYIDILSEGPIFVY